MQRVLLSTRTALVSEIMSICECDNIQNCRKIEKIISYLSWRKLYNWQSKQYWSTFRHFDEFSTEKTTTTKNHIETNITECNLNCPEEREREQFIKQQSILSYYCRCLNLEDRFFPQNRNKTIWRLNWSELKWTENEKYNIWHLLRRIEYSTKREK